jgi:hypothetical protein
MSTFSRAAGAVCTVAMVALAYLALFPRGETPTLVYGVLFVLWLGTAVAIATAVGRACPPFHAAGFQSSAG